MSAGGGREGGGWEAMILHVAEGISVENADVVGVDLLVTQLSRWCCVAGGFVVLLLFAGSSSAREDGPAAACGRWTSDQERGARSACRDPHSLWAQRWVQLAGVTVWAWRRAKGVGRWPWG